VGKDKELSKDERIKKEIKRLKNIYKDIDENKKSIVDGLIQRAAYMRVTLEFCEKDIIEFGLTEPFTQSPNTPSYERERPVARLYNTINKNYQTAMKQLSDFLPEDKNEKPDIKKENEDGFNDFVGDRHD
jgi:hypothetical protein